MEAEAEAGRAGGRSGSRTVAGLAPGCGPSRTVSGITVLCEPSGIALAMGSAQGIARALASEPSAAAEDVPTSGGREAFGRQPSSRCLGGGEQGLLPREDGRRVSAARCAPPRVRADSALGGEREEDAEAVLAGRGVVRGAARDDRGVAPARMAKGCPFGKTAGGSSVVAGRSGR